MEFRAEDRVFADLVVDEEICLEIHFAENIKRFCPLRQWQRKSGK
jgi:hypothetical protein